MFELDKLRKNLSGSWQPYEFLQSYREAYSNNKKIQISIDMATKYLESNKELFGLK
jgi:hypothetical protein